MVFRPTGVIPLPGLKKRETERGARAEKWGKPRDLGGGGDGAKRKTDPRRPLVGARLRLEKEPRQGGRRKPSPNQPGGKSRTRRKIAAPQKGEFWLKNGKKGMVSRRKKFRQKEGKFHRGVEFRLNWIQGLKRNENPLSSWKEHDFSSPGRGIEKILPTGRTPEREVPLLQLPGCDGTQKKTGHDKFPPPPHAHKKIHCLLWSEPLPKGKN